SIDPSMQLSRVRPTGVTEPLSAGALTHPLLMAGFAYNDTTSPIHRGVFMARHVLGRMLRPPPEAFAPLSPDLHEDLTTRQRVSLQTSPSECQTCHTTINDLGFAFESFDTVGRIRKTEKSKPIQSEGRYIAPNGESIAFLGIAQLSRSLVQRKETQRAFVSAIFEHFTGDPLAAYNREQQQRLLDGFRESGFHIRRLVADIAIMVASRE
ncbi:MAG: DUF1588 domain-containing protein, partial [Planctomycetota bacterium]